MVSPRLPLLMLLMPFALLAGLVPPSAATALAQPTEGSAAEETGDETDEEQEPERVPFEAPHPEGTDGIAIPLEVSRRPLPNFLTDDIANIPHTAPEGLLRDFTEVFMIGSNEARFAAVWDPRSCRLVGVLDLAAPSPPPRQPAAPESDTSARGDSERPDEAGGDSDSDTSAEESEPEPSPYLLRAAGPAPLLGSPGGGGTARYFGFRLVSGMPEFLHIFGNLLVEERIWFENEGEVLLQRFAVREPTADVVVTLPEDWAERCVASHGSWRGNVLTVPKDEADSLILAYRLVPEVEAESDEDDTTPNETVDP